MIAIDTSVVVALFASWHEAHHTARRTLAESPAIPTHVALESYSVLTRLPVPHRVPGVIVIEFLDRVFPPHQRLAASRELQAGLPARCSAIGIEGGAVYDALVAATALEHDRVLVTRDRRAVPVYRSMGVTVRVEG